ncbi:MAG: PpiC-type peptidyl-prolyl cis-trans isomerase [Candidatus Magasanikbacteria bacterium]|nr:PpiC-type peptidyl-prolyl cis-trans isomerase [Candidatus Magasanikbacteria bacterium]
MEPIQNAPTTPKSRRGRRILIIVVVVLVLAGVGLGGSVWAVYKKNWDNNFTRVMVRTLNLSAGTVNGDAVSLKDYLDGVATIKFVNAQALKDVEKKPDEAQMREIVWARWVRTNIEKQELARRGITVTPDDFEKGFSTMTATATDLDNELKERFNWNRDQFRTHVVIPFVYEEKLQNDLNKTALAKAEEVLKEVKEGKTSFEELAKKYSQDPGSAAKGGDLGFFSEGMMVPEFENAAFALKKGEVSGIVESQFGYHIIRVDEVKTEGKGADAKVTEVRARHILIGNADLDAFLKPLVDSAKIVRYVRL